MASSDTQGPQNPYVRNYMERRGFKLKRKDIDFLVQQNGGSGRGLDLSGCDLSYVDLRGMDLEGIIFGNSKTIKYHNEPGIERTSNLEGTLFDKANLSEAHFGKAILIGTQFNEAELYDATFQFADARGAEFRGAKLAGANFFDANLTDADFHDAEMPDINLERAILTGARLSMEGLGNKLIQEDAKKLKEHYEKWYIEPEIRKDQVQKKVIRRYVTANSIYIALKNAFSAAGRYHDAREAYFKERKFYRLSLAPWRANATASRREKNFNIKNFFRWQADWASEFISGYGEKPLRCLRLGVIIVAIFSFLLRCTGGIAVNNSDMSWWDYLNYSMSAFATVSPVQFTVKSSIAQLLTTVEALLGISVLALFMFTVGNRLRRGR